MASLRALGKAALQDAGGCSPPLQGLCPSGCREPKALFGQIVRPVGLGGEQQARVVELRFFSGLTVEETATALGISPKTVKRDWAVARAWLKREIGE